VFAFALPEPARRTAAALARAVLPPGQRFGGADEHTVARYEQLLASFDARSLPRFAGMLATLEHAARATHGGRPFSRLDADEADRFLDAWSDGDVVRRTLILALTAPLKMAYFDDPAVYARIGCKWDFSAKNVEREEYMARVHNVDADGDFECDVAVVGTGAGGAVVAKELAERGYAVILVEEGEYHGRESFSGRAPEGLRRFYRNAGLTAAVGNTVIPIPMGRLVGGSTAINTGTCWRTPEWVLRSWVKERGLEELSPEKLAPYFDRVERILEVDTAPAKYLGGVARVVARGADALGYRHFPLRRNAPGCDGSGVCDFGCPTDARRSTNISYVPAALKRGAQLLTGVRVERVLTDGARITGVRGRALATGAHVNIRARATVLACGTLLTPLLLQKHGLDRGLPHVGRNLSIHPATIVSALFDEQIEMYNAIPQGYCVDEFQREGILLLGASAPLDFGAAHFTFVGRKLMDVMDHYDRVASFGVMVEDASRGRVRLGPGGRPLILYWLGREERARLLRGVEITARIFQAAGAREVYPSLHGHRVLRDANDLARLRSARPAARDFLLSAFHPLGTCRMARTKKDGVVSPDHEVFGRPGLFIADGSVVPSALAVNPQVTIMALATRAAERIDARLSA
jgi:choline dehydrogenase-like flavoprotein